METTLQTVEHENNITITNEALKTKLLLIKSIERDARNGLYRIANLLRQIEAHKLYKDDGFKSTADMAEKVLGYKKQTTSNLINVATRFLDQDKPNLLCDGQAFSVYQYHELRPLTDEQIREHLITDLNPSMTNKQLREAVHKIKEKENSNTGKPASDPKPESEKKPSRDAKPEPESTADNTPAPEAESKRDEKKIEFVEPSEDIKVTFEFLQKALSNLSAMAEKNSESGVKPLIDMYIRDIDRLIKNRNEHQAEETRKQEAKTMAENATLETVKVTKKPRRKSTKKVVAK